MVMPWVVSFAGQKGGVGKSLMSQAFAVASVQAGDSVVLGDLDVAQRTTLEWGQWRAQNKILPVVPVKLIDPDRSVDFGLRQMDEGLKLLVLDAPGWSDERTLSLAGFSDVMVLPTGASVADLRPTIRLHAELTSNGIDPSRILTTLCHVQNKTEIKFANDYLVAAGMVVAAGVLHEIPEFRKLQNQGLSAVEAQGEKGRNEAMQLMSIIRGTLVNEQQRQTAQRFVPEAMRFQGNGR
jgi:chromosome partitioning protein